MQAEKLLWMPHSYFVNDHRQSFPSAATGVLPPEREVSAACSEGGIPSGRRRTAETRACAAQVLAGLSAADAPRPQQPLDAGVVGLLLRTARWPSRGRRPGLGRQGCTWRATAALSSVPALRAWSRVGHRWRCKHQRLQLWMLVRVRGEDDQILLQLLLVVHALLEAAQVLVLQDGLDQVRILLEVLPAATS